MFKKICFIVSAFGLLVLLGQQAQADFYKGYKEIGSGQITDEVLTKGATADGIRQTLLSQLLTADDGEPMVLEMAGTEIFQYRQGGTGNKYDKQITTRKFHIGVKHVNSKRGFNGKVDLVMVVPGFGASFKQGAGPYLSELLNRNGYLTVISNSPAHPDFIFDSSTHGAPGYQRRDARDLYDQLHEVIRVLGAEYEIDKVSVVGTSLGAMNVTLMAQIDRIKIRRKAADTIGIHKVIALNPPISNVFGITAIDTFVARNVGADKMNFSDRKDSYLAGLELLKGKWRTDTFEEVAQNSPSMLAEMNATNASDKNLQFLVGFGFADTIDEAIEPVEKRWADQDAGTAVSDSGYMSPDFFTQYLRTVSVEKSYVNDIDEYTQEPTDRRPSPRLRYDFLDTDKCLYGDSNDKREVCPFVIAENDSVGTVLQVMQQGRYDLSFYHLVTWDDDFLLRVPVAGKEAQFRSSYSQNDVEWIQSTLSGGDKGNSMVYTNGGGHMGGFYQPEFQQYLLDSLK